MSRFRDFIHTFPQYCQRPNKDVSWNMYGIIRTTKVCRIQPKLLRFAKVRQKQEEPVIRLTSVRFGTTV